MACHVVTAASPDAQHGRSTETTMTVFKDEFDEIIVIELAIHDVLTGII